MTDSVTGTPRLAPGGLRETGPLIWALSRLAGRVAGTTPPHVLTTLGRGRGLFWGWLHFAARLMPGGRLPRRSTELVIIRVAELRGCAYEREHHLRLGRRVGVTEEDLARLAAGSTHPGWAPADRVLLRAAEQLVADRALTEDAWLDLVRTFDERRALELVLLVGHYDMLATTLLVLRVQPDPPRRG